MDSWRQQNKGFLVFLLVITLDFGEPQIGYFPQRTDFSFIEFKNLNSSQFPDDNNGVPGGNCDGSIDARNLAGPVKFLNLSDTPSILVGGAGAIYLLDEDTLRCQNEYREGSNSTFVSQCHNAMDDRSGCFNFLSVYARFPSNNISQNTMLVCATNAGVVQDCVTVEIQNRMFNLSSLTPKTQAPFGLVSFFPQLGGFGEFRELEGNVSDTVFFSAGFYRLPDVNRDIGRNYNITFQNVSFDANTKQLILQRLLSIKDDQNWWNFPVEFVQYLKVSYPGDTQFPKRTHDFYYIFLREGVVGSNSNMKSSRVMRICQNDPGVEDVFSTMLKARIYCQREAPQDLFHVGSVDYRYEEINAVELTPAGGGRYKERIGWSDYMYAAFSGPQLGPPGTAICVYYNNVVTSPTQYNQGLYSVFLEDVVRPPGSSPSIIPNQYFACRPEGRPASSIDDVNINIKLAQIGEDPIIVLDGILVVKMVVDQVCVVQINNPLSCVNQDVFFVGTDLGRVLKIVLASVGTRNYETVVVEEFVVDSGSYVTDMAIRAGKLFVSTNTSLHSIAVERCSRLQGCRECIGARDPYCVWNNNTRLCETAMNNGLTLSGSSNLDVPQHIWQNVHTGMYDSCEVAENCTVRGVAVNASTVRCVAGCNFTSSELNISVTSPFSSSSSCSDDDDEFAAESVSGCTEFVLRNGLGQHTYSCIVQSRFTDDVTTPQGPPAEFESDVYASCGQTSCRICVQELDLTDDIESYTIQVEYNINGGADIMTTAQHFQQSDGCVTLTGLTPGSTSSYRILIKNSEDTTSSGRLSLAILDAEAGPVQNLASTQINSSSIMIQWQEPSVLNGTLLGYSISINGTPELVCASRRTDMTYTVGNLLPFTYYAIEVQACNNYGESTLFSGIIRRTECGIPSSVTNLDFFAAGTNLVFNWNSPQTYNGNISQEEYLVTLDCYKLGENITSRAVTVLSRTVSLIDHFPLANVPRILCCANVQPVTVCRNIRNIGIPQVVCGQSNDITPGPVVNLNVSDNSVGINSFVIHWDLPVNYNSSGLTFEVLVSGRPIYTVEQFLFVGNLEACEEYLVSVTSESSISRSNESRTLVVRTKPSLPSIPANVRLSYDNSSGTLLMSWNMPSEMCSTQTITYYRIKWGCDGNIVLQNSTNLVVTLTSSVNFSVCFAVVQSCDNYGRCSGFTEQEVFLSTAIPAPTLECYSYSESLSNVKVAFLFPSPFVTSQLTINWTLIDINVNKELSLAFFYNESSTNVINLVTDSNTQYEFNIFACNVYGCGNTCFLNFSTSVIPSQPYDLSATAIQFDSAVLTWNHSTSRPQDFSFLISITSSCPNIDTAHIINETTYTFNGLCSNDNYTVVVLAEDTQIKKRSIFSTPLQFTTKLGIPSAPQFVVLSDNRLKQAVVTWHPPRDFNIQISQYKVKLVKITVSCEENTGYEERVGGNMYSVVFPDFKEKVDDYTACVRGISTNEGKWGVNSVTPQGLESQQENCNSFIIACIFAGLAFITFVIMFALFIWSWCKCNSVESKP